MSSFETKKSLGQHFLRNPEIAEKIADAGEITAGETVLEIGPGTGILTEALLSRGARVIAIEADLRAILVLRERFEEQIAAQNLTIHHADIREATFKSLGLADGSFKLIANIPYYISGYLFRLALSGSIKPLMIVFLVQKEVAERIARSEKESLLSIGVKAYGDPEYVLTVKKGSFIPPPKVDSAVIRVRNISRERLAHVPDEHLFSIVRLGFASRRKQLFGCLKEIFPEAIIAKGFEVASIPQKARGEDLSVKQWVALASILPKFETAEKN